MSLCFVAIAARGQERIEIRKVVEVVRAGDIVFKAFITDSDPMYELSYTDSRPGEGGKRQSDLLFPDQARDLANDLLNITGEQYKPGFSTLGAGSVRVLKERSDNGAYLIIGRLPAFARFTDFGQSTKFAQAILDYLK